MPFLCGFFKKHPQKLPPIDKLHHALKLGDYAIIETMKINQEFPLLNLEQQWDCLRLACSLNDERILDALLSAYPDSISHQGVKEDTLKIIFNLYNQNGESRDPSKLAVYCAKYYFISEATILSKEISSSTPYKESCLTLASRNSNPQVLKIVQEAINNAIYNHLPAFVRSN